MRHFDGGRAAAAGPAPGPRERRYYVYILATPSREFHLGVTNDLARRLFERRAGGPSSTGSIMEAARLVYFEVTFEFRRAIARKQRLEGWNRKRMWRLVESVNPEWKDLWLDEPLKAVSGER